MLRSVVEQLLEACIPSLDEFVPWLFTRWQISLAVRRRADRPRASDYMYAAMGVASFGYEIGEALPTLNIMIEHYEKILSVCCDLLEQA